MLTLVGYDISDPKRLNRVARICEDYGVRVQYSFFECLLEESEFQDFWLKLLGEIDEDSDRLVAYKIDSRSAKETLTAGDAPVGFDFSAGCKQKEFTFDLSSDGTTVGFDKIHLGSRGIVKEFPLVARRTLPVPG